MPRRSPEKEQEESSIDIEDSSSQGGDEPSDLNQMLVEIQRKVTARYQKLQRTALTEAEKETKSIKAEYQLVKDTRHKQELNDIHDRLSQEINQRDTTSTELYLKLSKLEEEVQKVVRDEIDSWKESNEECMIVFEGCEKVMEKSVKG
ncbi:hypothetical protein V865_005649 [Kwoniella europaea PYCC6329]|uniref:Coiled-coil domain-containing protein 153 n=1 Tax=Kwoniella europaea PYCC6329 TaxID=1423913 RepID=A0AAX4KPC7_9TREE